MGSYLSKWRHKPSTIEVLEELAKNIDYFEKRRQTNLEQQKHIITSLILYSIGLYILFAIIFYFYFWPNEWKYRIIYSLPLLLFPCLIWMIKKFLHWYFVKRIRRNEDALEELKEKKRIILDEVMERETYKKAKEILEKFSPEVNTDMIKTKTDSPMHSSGELRHRSVAQTGKDTGPTSSSVLTQKEPCTPRLSQTMGPLSPSSSDVMSSVRSERLPPQRPPPQWRQFTPAFPMVGGPPPGPPMARPVLPRERTLMDRMVEYFLGDGPQNRYALICSECLSHNGMAIKEEFEYLSFRCCYCYAVNQARKQKPKAPPLETFRSGSTEQQSSSSSAVVTETSDASHDKVTEEKSKVTEEKSKVEEEKTESEDSEPTEM